MIKFLLTFLLFANCFAKYPYVLVEDANLNLDNSIGAFTATKAMYHIDPVLIKNESLNAKLELLGKDKLKIEEDKFSVLLYQNLEFITSFSKLSFETLNLSLKDNSVLLNVKNILLDGTSKFFLDLNHVRVESVVQDLSKDRSILDNILEHFLLEVKTLYFKESLYKEFLSELKFENRENKNYVLELENYDSQTKLNELIKKLYNIRLDINKNELKLSGKIDGPIDFGVYVGADVNYLNKEKLVRIKVNYAKIGYFHARKLILKQIKKLNLKGVSIDEKKGIIDITYDQK